MPEPSDAVSWIGEPSVSFPDESTMVTGVMSAACFGVVLFKPFAPPRGHHLGIVGAVGLRVFRGMHIEIGLPDHSSRIVVTQRARQGAVDCHVTAIGVFNPREIRDVVEDRCHLGVRAAELAGVPLESPDHHVDRVDQLIELVPFPARTAQQQHRGNARFAHA